MPQVALYVLGPQDERPADLHMAQTNVLVSKHLAAAMGRMKSRWTDGGV
jgi:hypothetical protein